MVSRSDDEPMLSRRAAQELFLTCSTVAQVKAIVARCHEAFHVDPASMRWFAEQFSGRPRMQDKSVKDVGVELDVTSLEACARSYQAIADAQASGAACNEQADALRATVSAASANLRSMAGEKAAEILDELGSLPVYLEAGKDPAQAFREAMSERGGDDGPA